MAWMPAECVSRISREHPTGRTNAQIRGLPEEPALRLRNHPDFDPAAYPVDEKWLCPAKNKRRQTNRLYAGFCSRLTAASRHSYPSTPTA